MPPTPNGYSASLTKQRTGAVLEYEENVNWNGTRAFGAHCIITLLPAAAGHNLTFNVVQNTQTNQELNQQVDILYDGAVRGRVSFRCNRNALGEHEGQYDATLDPSIPVSIEGGMIP